MEKVNKQLNWIYYGQMVVSLLVLTVMYYALSKNLFQPVDPLNPSAQNLQYFVIFDALITIPLGLYLVKLFKPRTEKKYFKIAALRILLVSNTMPLGIITYYAMGCYRSMLWVAAIAAIGWYFTKPSIARMEQEMTPPDPNQPTY